MKKIVLIAALIASAHANAASPTAKDYYQLALLWAALFCADRKSVPTRDITGNSCPLPA